MQRPPVNDEPVELSSVNDTILQAKDARKKESPLPSARQNARRWLASHTETHTDGKFHVDTRVSPSPSRSICPMPCGVSGPQLASPSTGTVSRARGNTIGNLPDAECRVGV
jgi:hypothetical protein